MEIGILTVHRAINVGAVLQCYALQEVLKSLGHNVWVINYVQEKVERVDRKVYGFKTWMNMLFHGHLRGFFFYGPLRKRVAKVYKCYDDFLSNYLHLTEECDENHIPTTFDRYVIGSDQLWNSNIFGYHDKVFWGYFNHKVGSKIVAYAPSSSAQNLLASDHTFLGNSLKNFTYLSSREQEVSNYLSEHFKVDVQVVLDPTLLAEKRIWEKMINGKHKGQHYVLVYGARPYKSNPNLLYDMAKPLAKQIGCEVRGLSYETLQDFIDLVSNASAIVTSSFHGVAFSLIFNKPLYAVKYGDEQDARYVNLLNDIGASDMLVYPEDKLTIKTYNYEHINAKIEDKRMKSLAYIKQICL